MATTREYIISALTLILLNESHEDAYNGIIAVANVIRNRILAGWEGGSWLKLLSRHNEFDGNEREVPKLDFGDINSPFFRQVFSIADSCYSGTLRDLTAGTSYTPNLNPGGALWYASLSEEIKPWFKEQILEKPEVHSRIAKIGKKDFFK